MGGVDVQDVEARLPAAPRGRRVLRQRGVDVGPAHLARRRPPRIGGERRGADGLPGRLAAFADVDFGEGLEAVPRPLHRRLAPGVQDLGAGRGALLPHDAGGPRQRPDARIVPTAEVAVGETAPRRDAQRLGEDEARAAHGEAPVVGEVVIGGQAVAPRRVLLHRRDGDPVLERDPAQHERREEPGRRSGVRARHAGGRPFRLHVTPFSVAAPVCPTTAARSRRDQVQGELYS